MTNTTCLMCGAFEEWDVRPAYHPIVAERGRHYLRREKPCRCKAIEAAKADAKIMTGVCECGAACHANSKRCIPCSVAHDLRRVDKPYPKCTCGKQLKHHLAQRCDDCKRSHNRIMNYRRWVRKRDAARTERAA